MDDPSAVRTAVGSYDSVDAIPAQYCSSRIGQKVIALAAAKSLSSTYRLYIQLIPMNDLLWVDERGTFSEGLLQSRGNTLLVLTCVVRFMVFFPTQ